MLGELIPVGGGDPIPLLKASLVVGRRESCDVVLRFGNVSGQHCQLTLESGYWFVQDLGSQNGTKVNGERVMRKRLNPSDKLSVAKHNYEIQYVPVELGASGPPPSDDNDYDQIMGKSLLERAGLSKRPLGGDASRRFNPNDDAAGQLKKKRDLE
jgi:pSer/pThr/pTyr-binding forkhead associated (FHA) protein